MSRSFARAARRSCCRLPRASAISTFNFPFLKYMRVGTTVKPRSVILPIHFRSSRFLRKSFLGRSASWFSWVPCE